MSLAKTLNGGKQKTKVHVSEIRENPKNTYMSEQYYSKEDTDMEVVALANSIEKHGQLHNAVVFAETSDKDDKKYTLLSGAKRFRAITYLFENNRGDGMIDVVIQDKPTSVMQEVDIIHDANLQRRPELKNHKLLYQEILQKEQQYDELKANGEIPKGLFKRVYVATHLGIAEGTVTNIKNEFEGTAPTKVKQKSQRAIEKEALSRKLKSVAEEIEAEVSSACDKVKLTSKELTFKFDTMEDLNHLLELLKLDVRVEEN